MLSFLTMSFVIDYLIHLIILFINRLQIDYGAARDPWLGLQKFNHFNWSFQIDEMEVYFNFLYQFRTDQYLYFLIRSYYHYFLFILLKFKIIVSVRLTFPKLNKFY